ncbi:reverse transcriptase domain-containing protein [Tanacetum coccineum]
MFRLVKKLKNLKKPFCKLLYDEGNIHENVNRLRTELDRVQADLDVDPFNVVLREEEVAYVQAYNVGKFNPINLCKGERFLKQKAKILWLKEGDSNSAYFHKVVKGKVSRSRINVVTDSAGTIYENDCVVEAFVSHYEVFLGHEGVTSPLNFQGLYDQGKVSRSRINVVTDSAGTIYENDCVVEAFVSHYEVFLGHEGVTSPLNFQGLYDQVLDNEAAVDMIREVCDNEIKEALFSMGNDKSPGPDEYTAAFFKEAWDIVGHDVIKAVKEFFTNGKLLKELNHTIIALIPKVQTPSRVNDYRLISCCNVLFKCISKIIANRIKGSLKFLISPNQLAFVPGRSISDNILLTQELMHNYHLDRGVPRCTFKVDIQKAHDTVD